MKTKSELSSAIKTILKKHGFHKVGIAAAGEPARASFLDAWLQQGRHGTMAWMENYKDKRKDVRALFPGARSVVSVALNYYKDVPHSQDINHAKISRYAWGKDYHTLMKKKLKHSLSEIKKLDENIDGRLCVDTAPAMDKLWAVQAGIGWQGKNTNILTRDYGSWFFLGELILNVELQYDTPMADYCGSCTACIDACPTDALEEYRIDARSCISYLTIEHWDRPIPEEYEGKLENWVFGCDICQDVCPWNNFRQVSDVPEFEPDPENIAPELKKLLDLDEAAFKKRFKKTPVFRARYHNFMQNVKAVLRSLKKNDS